MYTTSSTGAAVRHTPGVGTFTPVQLLRLTQLFASDLDLPDSIGPDPDRPGERSWRVLADSPQLQVWLIRWPVGTSTGWHDHGGARGGFTVVSGTLTEHTRERTFVTSELRPGEGRAFGGRPRRRGTRPVRCRAAAGVVRAVHDGIDALLAAARSRVDRITPAQAWQEVREGSARLVDIRPAAQRAVEGEVAEVLDPWVIERNVLEWRLDPRQEASLPGVALTDRVIVLCQEGYTSSLAADSLRSIGVEGATDVVGGFAAWRDLGLPMTRLRAA